MRVVSRAWLYAGPAFLLGLLTILVSPLGAIALFAMGLAVLAFFRDPEREPPSGGVLSPADGRVSVLREDDGRVHLGVFMNVIDVHVNRAPVTGEVLDVDHRAGAHRPAFSKASDRNERVRIKIDAADGTYTVDLIAGAFARRITPYVEAGDRIDRGQRIGHIAFGSRVDVRFPPAYASSDVTVDQGDRVRAGTSRLTDEHTLMRSERDTSGR